MKNDTVLILGLGASGLAMARWCTRAGAKVRVWDSREAPPQAEALAREMPEARRVEFLPLPPAGEGGGRSGGFEPHAASPLSDPGLQAGMRTASEGRGGGADAPSPQPSPASGRGSAAEALDGVTLVLKSPGLAPYDPRIAPLAQEARVRGIPVLGELDLFVRALADLKESRGYAPQLLAVTGTNGKTTTTAMTALLVERAGKRVGLAGNIGPTLLDALAAAIAEDKLPQVWVLELSSFQLEGGGTGVLGFAPDAAAVLNVTQDHLDWHGPMAAYTAAKARIFGPVGARGVMVLNRDDPLVEAMAPAAPAAPARGKSKTVPRKVMRFGLQGPERPGDFGIVVENGMAWLVRALPADETLKAKPGEEVELHLQRLMPVDALRVRGRHNAANALAALALATAIGCPLAPMLHGLREYAGEPHRVQWVASVGDIEAYDDSKGTNVGATVAALEGIGADKAPAKLVVILGGDGKGQDFAPLAAPVLRHARAVATLGRDAGAIEAVLIDAVAAGVTLQRHETLEAATRWCFEQARPGDAVLLSPACASLDMFRNYEHRAEVFVQTVQGLAQERGAV